MSRDDFIPSEDCRPLLFRESTGMFREVTIGRNSQGKMALRFGKRISSWQAERQYQEETCGKRYVFPEKE